ncbi:MAG: hypothetical protein U0800_19955 [Isosphaeraceae bacterium]
MQTSIRWRWSLCLVALMMGAEDPARDEIQVGSRAPVTSATAACGPWLKRCPLDAESYGKVRGVSPATSPDAKLLIYARKLDGNFFRLAKAIDAVVADNPRLEWSFVQVLDERGAQRGGYSAEELERRLAEIRDLAKEHGIEHLSFVVSAPSAGSFAPRLGLVDGPDVLVAHLEPGADGDRSSLIRWFRRGDSSKLDEAAIGEWTGALQESVGRR